jgi:hypothetical protein
MKLFIKGLICFAFVLVCILLAGCNTGPTVSIQHSPIIATENENVTFSATAGSGGTSPFTVDIYVNNSVVKTCSGISGGSTCIFTSSSPYTSFKNSTVSYQAKIKDSGTSIKSNESKIYYFAITDTNYAWSKSVIPARYVDTHDKKIDLVFHRDSDLSMSNFIDNVEYKIWSVFGKQDYVKNTSVMDMFNFYVYDKTASSTNCGTVDNSINTDAPWRNADVVLHTANLQDCTIDSHYSAEGSDTKAFLHESGHGIFSLYDEYDAAPSCYTNYQQSGNEPNIFSSETNCRTEQTAKSRDPNACWKFTTCQSGWWGIHKLTDNTVMINGMVGNPWGIEAREHLVWFSNNPSFGIAEAGNEAVIIIPIHYKAGIWEQGGEPMILPCFPETPLMTGVKTNPFVRLVDEGNKDLYSYYMVNDPTFIFIESGEGPLKLENLADGVPYRLNEVTFTLRLPYFPNVQRFEFVSNPGKGEAEQYKPDFTIDLTKLVREFTLSKGLEQAAPCQDPTYKP